MEHVFIRGSQIRFFILPDMLKNAPMFHKDLAKKSAVRGNDGILSLTQRFLSFFIYFLFQNCLNKTKTLRKIVTNSRIYFFIFPSLSLSI